MRSCITAAIKTSNVITLHYYDKTSYKKSDIQEIMMNDGTFQFTLNNNNKYGEILKIMEQNGICD